jgi:transposase
MERPTQKLNDLGRCLTALDPDGTLIAVIEMSQSGRLVAGIVPDVELARWLREREIEAQVIHASSVAVPREHRRAKTDRLDTELLKRAFVGSLRGERDHCKMVAIPTIKDEDSGPAASVRVSLENKIESSIV